MMVELADIHCHILPGIDDGPAGMAETVDMARAFLKLGYSHVVATPHVQNIFPKGEDIYQLTSRVQEMLLDLGLELRVLPGAEILLHADLPFLLREKLLPTLNHSRYVLVELPIFEPFPDYAEGVFLQLLCDEFIPILAHPERNRCFAQDIPLLTKLTHFGVLLQVDQLSLMGAYGPSIRRMARHLFKEGLANFVASNSHGLPRNFTYFEERQKMFSVWNQVQGQVGRRGMEEIYFTNPECLLHNMPLIRRGKKMRPRLIERALNLLS